tara:strand:+ start:272 stop:541 length:270 start_codon:yes stop_codon:yes gene_type:complete
MFIEEGSTSPLGMSSSGGRLRKTARLRAMTAKIVMKQKVKGFKQNTFFFFWGIRPVFGPSSGKFSIFGEGFTCASLITVCLVVQIPSSS